MEEIKQVPIRVPADLKAWLRSEATKHRSSMNSEIIRAVRERMEKVEESTQ